MLKDVTGWEVMAHAANSLSTLSWASAYEGGLRCTSVALLLAVALVHVSSYNTTLCTWRSLDSKLDARKSGSWSRQCSRNTTLLTWLSTLQFSALLHARRLAISCLSMRSSTASITAAVPSGGSADDGDGDLAGACWCDVVAACVFTFPGQASLLAVSAGDV